MDTQSDKPSIDPLQRCDLWEQKINPTVKIYNNDTRLCKACFGHMENLPEVVAKSVERFLIGNVVWVFDALICHLLKRDAAYDSEGIDPDYRLIKIACSNSRLREIVTMENGRVKWFND